MSFSIKRYILILLLLQTAWQSNFAQVPDYHVQKISKQSGLSNNSQIREVMKDNKGFLWLLVASKVHRFDGKKIVSFSFDEVCVSVIQDEDGTVWLATRHNIYRFLNDHTGFVELKEYTSVVPWYRRLIIGPGKKLYLLSNDGVTRWNNTSKKFEGFGIKPYKSTGSFSFLKSVGDYLFYKLNDSTLARYNTVSTAVDHARVMDANFLFTLNEDSVFVRQTIGNSVLVSFSAKTITTVDDKQINDGKMPGGRFFVRGAISRSPSEYLLLVDNMGCLVYNTQKNNYTKVNFFYDGKILPIKPFPILNNFYKEENGTVWLVNEDGLVYFNPASTVFNLLSSDGDWNNDIRNFTEDDQNNIWFSTANGFSKWHKNTGKISSWTAKFDAQNYLNYSSVRSIGFSSGKLLIGQSEKGFWVFDPIKETFKRLAFENDSVMKRFNRDFNHNGLKLRNGNFLALSNRTWLIEKETFAVREIKLHDSADAARSGYEDEQGRIWLMGRGGIFAVDSNFNELYSHPDRVRGRWYNAIVQIDAETFWVAAKTIFELKLQPNRKLSIRPIFPEFKNAHFSHFFKDSLKRIWMSEEQGMYRYVPEKHLFEKYDHNDNIRTFYVSVSNSFRGRDGTVYFGSTDGINYFVPEKIPLQNDSLQVHLLNVTVNHDDSSFLLHGSFPKLNYYQNSMVFDFIAPYVYNADKLQYRCKLEGIDGDWIQMGNNTTMRFTSLSPGRYSFVAAASLNGKDWHPFAAPFTFEISPPFWKTWWFISIVVASCVLLAIVLFRRRIATIKAKAAIDQQLAGLEIRALRSQMNPHFIFNSLNSISQLVASRQNDEGLQYLNKFSKLLRLVLEESENSFISLKDEIKILDLYLQLETLRFGSSFSYSIHSDEAIDEEETLVPCFLIHPIIENAIWHGLLHKEGERRLIINFHQQEKDKLECVVKDNGIGIEAASQKKAQRLNGEKRQSKGLKIVKDRLALMEQQQHTTTAFRMEDMKDENGFISGTKVTIQLPVQYE